MADRLGFVVATFNQASGRPELDVIGLHADLDDAVYEREAMADETAAAGRGERHVVCEVVPVEDEDG